MGLNGRGYISIAQIIAYVPILALSGILVRRHGVKKTQGWIFLVIFSVARIIGGILFIVEEETTNPSKGLITATLVVQTIGLSPLIEATTGFLLTIGQGAGLASDHWPISRIVHAAVGLGVILGIIAGQEASKPQDAGLVSAFRKISALLFFGTFLFLVGLHGYFWLNRSALLPSRRTFLLAISSALLWLFPRLVYTLGGAFESSTDTTFNLLTGSTTVFLLLSAIPEFLTVITYLVGGMLIPFTKETDFDKLDSANASAFDVSGRRENDQSLLRDPRVDNDGMGAYTTPYDHHRPHVEEEYAPPAYPPSSRY